MGMASRLMELYKRIPEFDLSFSLGGNFTATNSWLRRKPSIIFSDNDISFKALAYGFGPILCSLLILSMKHLRPDIG